MKKLFRIATGIVLAGAIMATTTGCYVVYDHRGGGHGHGYYHRDHNHSPGCSPHNW